MWDEHDLVFKELFRGHPDAYGGENGVCIKQPPTDAVWDSHLRGTKPIGIYCMMPGNCVTWACTDIDVDDFPMAVNLARTLRSMGVTPFIETSRRKGYHVWVFFDEEVPARHARDMMLLAHQVSGVPVREVNPKQYELTEKKPYGNYVRLPYPFLERATVRRKVLQGETFKVMPYEAFVWRAHDTRTPVDVAEEWANKYAPPVRPKPIVVPSKVDDSQMAPLTRHVFNNGPGVGYDRSGTLVRLARLLSADGFDRGSCKALLLDADERWGKYFDRSDRLERIDEIVNTYYV